MIRHRSFAHHMAALVGALMAAACSQAVDDPPEETESSSEAIIGGREASSAKYAAIGALGWFHPDFPDEGVWDVFCSATLIHEKAIVTARHCIPDFSPDPSAPAFLEAGFIPVFVHAASALFSQELTPIVDYVIAPPLASNGGLLEDGGRDVAVAYLASAPAGVRPAKLGEFKSSSLGKRFKIGGYGRNGGPEGGDASYYGDRFVGNATARADRGYWYPLLFGGNFKKFLKWYHTDSAYSFDGVTSDEEAAALWTYFELEPKYELLVGGLKGEAVPCHIDSGGPMFVEDGKHLTVFGSSFAVEDSASKVCALGGAYVAFNDTILDFVRTAIGEEEVKKPRDNCFRGRGKGHKGKSFKGPIHPPKFGRGHPGHRR